MELPAEIRSEWIKHLFSTHPANRPDANAGVCDLYRAAGFEQPQHLLWFQSPFQASWAVALLLRSDSFHWRQVLATEERTPAGQELLAGISADLCRQVGTSSLEGAVAAAGRPLGQHWVQPDFSQGFPKFLQTAIFEMRMELHDNDPAQLFVLPSESDDLARAEDHFATGTKAVLANQVEWQVTGPIRSTSFLADYSFWRMAADEAKSATRPVPPLLTAAWSIARASGLWWPFSNAAVLTDRPAEIHYDDRFLLHRADGPAAVYRDGAKLYAWHGMSIRESWIIRPDTIPAGELKHLPADFRKHVETKVGITKPGKKKSKASDIFKAELPADHASRLHHLREHARGNLPRFERYIAGEHSKVWSELVALGAAVREEPNAADALAVAYETMQRVEQNVRTVVGRLRQVNYQFRTPGMELDAWTEMAESLATIDPLQITQDQDSPHLNKLLGMFKQAQAKLADQVKTARQKPRDHKDRAHVPPGKQVRKQIVRLEKMVGPVPLSLRAFYEVVGTVDWIGTHPSLAPESSDICPDPFVVFSVEDALEEAQEIEDGENFITIAPDDLHKADTSGGDPYQVAVPDPRADAELLNERHRLFFVDYLRLCFRFGGFPGYEGIDRGLPGEIATLREGLLDF